MPRAFHRPPPVAAYPHRPLSGQRSTTDYPVSPPSPVPRQHSTRGRTGPTRAIQLPPLLAEVCEPRPLLLLVIVLG
ncbi:hypothetical protein C8Q79DRAFT_982755 [Trametes meyenii]|nr:hypothetical protein C8Q79DRAFT_982755 [Trametes meyenii]